jgi:hypothetical protein
LTFAEEQTEKHLAIVLFWPQSKIVSYSEDHLKANFQNRCNRESFVLLSQCRCGFFEAFRLQDGYFWDRFWRDIFRFF